MDNLQYNPTTQIVCGVGDAHNMVMYPSPSTWHHEHHNRGVICGQARVMATKPPPQPCYCIRKGSHKIKLTRLPKMENFSKD